MHSSNPLSLYTSQVWNTPTPRTLPFFIIEIVENVKILHNTILKHMLMNNGGQSSVDTPFNHGYINSLELQNILLNLILKYGHTGRYIFNSVF